jgi:hypothetical protein
MLRNASLHSDVKVLNMLNKIQRQSENYKEWVHGLNNGTTKWLHRRVISESILAKVFSAMPPQPWPRNIHKEIAATLEITNKMAQKCIETLIERGKWPDFKSQNDTKSTNEA